MEVADASSVRPGSRAHPAEVDMITVVGEALVDLIAVGHGPAFVAHPGGSPANVAVGLARLGVRTRLGAAYGRDLFGAMVEGHLAAAGVEALPLPAATPGTSVAFAATDAEGVARYDFRITWDIEHPPPFADAGCLHTGSLATALPPGAAVVEAAMARARAEGVTVSFDPNIRPSLAGPVDVERARVERQVGLSDVVKASQEDLAWLYPDRPPAECARDWLAMGPRLVLVTLGGAGAMAMTPAGAARRRVPPVRVADTVGAGDAFTAATLCWLHRGGLLGRGQAGLDRLAPPDLEALLDFANAVAAMTCAVDGANPPALADLGPALDHLPAAAGGGDR